MAEGREHHRRLAEVVRSWSGRAALVVGDAMLDEWRFAESDRLCREAPAPVLTLRRRIASAGGAANTAVNLTALGGRAALVSPVGADVAGDELHDCLDRAGVWDRTVTQPGRPTPVKRRLLAADQILLREDEGDADGSLPPGGTRRLIRALACAVNELRAETGEHHVTLVVCDYGLGALPGAVRSWLISHRELFGTVALDAHDLSAWHGLAPTVVTPSFAEASRLLDGGRSGRPGGTARVPDGSAARSCDSTGPDDRLVADRTSTSGVADRTGTSSRGTTDTTGQADRAVLARTRLAELRERTGATVVAITLDADGAVVGGADGQYGRSHATRVPASYAVGAGDAYLAAMTLALAAGAPLPTAANLAQLAATSTVSDTGTCVCRRDHLLATLGPNGARATAAGADPPADGVLDPEVLVGVVERHRDQGRTVVFTNGCFDVLHPGHVRYLEQARKLGDLLVVAVNSDDSVCRLKGSGRPVNPVEDRAALLAALSCVDHVVVFEEDSPATLIEAVRPDLYVKGGDYPPEMVPEAPLVHRLGGQVRTLGYVPDRSTSAIIDRIRAHGADRPVAVNAGHHRAEPAQSAAQAQSTHQIPATQAQPAAQTQTATQAQTTDPANADPANPATGSRADGPAAA